MQKKFLFLSVLLTACLVGALSVLGWVDPTSAPPINSNVPPPINVSSVGQSKAGTIGATQFIDFNNPAWFVDPSQDSFFSGRIGVGKSSALEALDVNGRIVLDAVGAPATVTNKLYNIGGVLYWNGSPLVSGSNYWTANGNNISNSNTGNVGVGTVSPNQKLVVNRTLVNDNWDALAISNSGSWGSATGKHANLIFTDSVALNHTVAAIGATYQNGLGRIDFHSFYNGGYGSDANMVMSVVGNGNVGIGTTTPSEKLEVNGNIKLSTGVGVYGAGRTQAISNGDLVAYTLNSTSRVWDLISIVSSNPDYFAIRDFTAGLVRFAISETGNIGIGTVSPSYKLTVSGDSHVTGGIAVGGYTPDATYKVTTPTLYSEQALIGAATGGLKGAGSINAQQVCINGVCQASWPASSGGTVTGSGTDNYIPKFSGTSSLENSGIYQSDAGNIGIGTISPAAKLDIQGQIIGGFGAQSGGGTLDWDDVSNTRSGSGYSLLLGTAANGPGMGTYFHPFNFEYSSKNGTGNITQLAIPYSATSNLNSGLYMRGRYSGAWSPWIRIIAENTSGNVGIATITPSYKLDVTGDTRITGGIAVGGYTPDPAYKVTTPTFYTAQASITQAIVGAPTGGLKGAGSINAQQVCINGVCQASWPASGAGQGFNYWSLSGSNLSPSSTAWNVGIGTNAPTKKFEVVGGPIKATGGLIIETVTTDPVGAEVGRMWLCTDAGGDCQ